MGIIGTHVAGGGAEDLTAKTIRLLIDAGHSVTLYARNAVTTADYRRFYDEILMCSIRITRSPFNASAAFLPSRYRFLINELWSKRIKDEDTILDLSPSIVPLYVRNPNLVYFHNVPNFDLAIPNSGFMKLAFSPYNVITSRLARKFVMDEDVHRITNSRFTQNGLANRGVRSRVIYPPVDLDRWRESQTHNQRRGVVSVARFAPQDPQKRHEWQLEIMRGRREDLIAIGNCLNSVQEAHLSRLRAKAPPNIVFITNASIKLLKQILQRRKVFLHTALDEPFGISIVQSIAAGCVPLVHDSGGPREIVPNKELRFKTVSEARIKLDKALRGEYDHLMPGLEEYINRFSIASFRDEMLTELIDDA